MSESKTYYVVTDCDWGREAVKIVSKGTPLRVTDRFDAHELICERPRYVFFLGWSHKVPPSVTGPIECVNFHCTDLPFGRGGHPIENLINLGYIKTVITAHRMTDEFDGGPIYGKSQQVSLLTRIGREDVLRRFSKPVADLMETIIKTEPIPIPQAGKVTRFRRLPNDTLKEIWRRHVQP